MWSWSAGLHWANGAERGGMSSCLHSSLHVGRLFFCCIAHTEVVFLPERVNRGTRAKRSGGSDGKFWTTRSARPARTSRVDGRHRSAWCTWTYREICPGTRTCMEVFFWCQASFSFGLRNVSWGILHRFKQALEMSDNHVRQICREILRSESNSKSDHAAFSVCSSTLIKSFHSQSS